MYRWNLRSGYKRIRDTSGYEEEIIILNKTDLLDSTEIKRIMNNFSKNKDSEVLTLSTLEKNSISKIKAKLLSYVS